MSSNRISFFPPPESIWKKLTKLRKVTAENLGSFPLWPGTRYTLERRLQETPEIMLSLVGSPHHKNKRIRKKHWKRICRVNARVMLAEAMIMPIRKRLNYTSIARQIFKVEPLPQGALPSYSAETPQGTSP